MMTLAFLHIESGGKKNGVMMMVFGVLSRTLGSLYFHPKPVKTSMLYDERPR